ncbi:hypothetical protein K523DRAFT_411217 [Schizophyllum commune Tattone D]|nr:hypothetical protein K523DRAFT_411217 [Schizophyllum commune Tattone D]
MEKVGDDQWTAEGVSSTFKISATRKQNGRQYTGSCGFGWRFTYGTLPRNSYSTNVPWTLGERPTLYIGFDPFLLSNSSLGNVVVKTICTNSQAPQENLFTASLSTKYSSYDNYAGGYIHGVELCTFTFDTVELLQTAIVTFSLSFSSCPDVHLPVRLPPSAAQQSILRSLGSAVSGADLNNVEFVLPSSKRNGSVIGYKAVYGNREALKGISDYLDTLLFDEHFAESKPQPFGRFGLSSPVHDLDYADDSDVDEDLPSHIRKKKAKMAKRTASAAGAGPSKDVQPKVNENAAETGEQEPDAGDGVVGRSGRVVRINDFAFQTWRALVLYLYTGEITFCALKSSGTCQASSELPPTACSPKSMYRVAHMLEMKDLQDRCLQNIKSQLDAKNIVKEIFSVFTSRYIEVRDMEVPIFKTHYTACAQERKRMMLKVAKGELPHCGEVVNAFMDLLA